MPPRIDDGLGDRRKKEKTGFKVDRAARYMEKHRKELEAAKGISSSNAGKRKQAEAPKKVKEVKFDEDGRKEYLLTLHKKKNERRANAMIQARRKQQKENQKFRTTSREEARKQYNSYAKVPILPNYTFKLPQGGQDEDDESDADSDDDDDDEDYDNDAEKAAAASMLADDVMEVFAGQSTKDHTAKLSGMSLHTSDHGEAPVTVDVQPLFGARTADGVSTAAGITSGKKNRFAGGLDFSDLPSDVAGKLEHLMKGKKGPAQKKPRVSLVREMQKFHKIKKHSRKKK